MLFIFSDGNGLKLEIPNANGKISDYLEINSPLLNNQGVKEEIFLKIKKHKELKRDGNKKLKYVGST